jgi:hypothetical protein
VMGDPRDDFFRGGIVIANPQEKIVRLEASRDAWREAALKASETHIDVYNCDYCNEALAKARALDEVKP